MIHGTLPGDSTGMLSGGGSLPLGLAMQLAQNRLAAERYADLTEAEKEQLIIRSKAAGSKSEMRLLVDDLLGNTLL